MIILIVILVLLILVTLYVIGVYNGLKKLQVRIKASIQEIGNQLKREFSLIPNLESTVKGSAQHEKDVIGSLASARAGINSALSSPTATNLEAANKSVQSVLSGMRAVIESNPELKANANFAQLMKTLEDTADKVMYSRRLLIDLTAKYNEKLQVFPSNLIANMFGFKPEEGLITPTEGAHLEVSSAETQGTKVDFNSQT